MAFGAPIGNTNATKNKPWIKAINRAIAQSDPERLRRIAEALLDKAADGDIAAIRELGDRLDGKPQQGVTLSGDPDNPLGVLSLIDKAQARLVADPIGTMGVLTIHAPESLAGCGDDMVPDFLSEIPEPD